MAGRRAVLGVLVVGLVVASAAACSSTPSSTSAPPGTGKDGGTVAPNTKTGATSDTNRKPKGAAATLSGPITTGEITRPADPRNSDLAAKGYVEEEFFAEGTATTYKGDGELGP